jgi:polysaccharide deacetylase family protein (PEP-CTERM system associated)
MEKNKKMINALTVDVEEYYQVEAFAEVVRSQDWENWESRVEGSTARLLELLARRNIRGTFFVLGWLAERRPYLVRKIADAGHEIACHGYSHCFISHQSREEFRQDVRRAKAVLEDLTGTEVEGYRAPTYSITAATLWALDILIEEGFRYDSSIFPIHHDRYGIPDAKRFPHVIRCGAGEILEFPPSTVRLAGQNLPLVGGGYFRILPYGWFRWGLKHLNNVEQQAAIFMVHAWEVDPEQPRVPGTRLNVWRHRFNLHKTEARLTRLLDDFQFSTVRDVLQLSERPVHVAEPSLIRPNPLYVHD